MKPTYEELEVDIAFLKVEIAQLKYALTGRTVSCDFCNQAARERDEARAMMVTLCHKVAEAAAKENVHDAAN